MPSGWCRRAYRSTPTAAGPFPLPPARSTPPCPRVRASHLGRQRAARGYLGAVGQSRAFELAEREESLHEHLKPVPDLRELVAEPLIGGKARGPPPRFRGVPSVPGQESDLRGPEPVAQDVEEGEVLQRVRTDFGLAALHLFVLAGRNQLRVISVSRTDLQEARRSAADTPSMTSLALSQTCARRHRRMWFARGQGRGTRCSSRSRSGPVVSGGCAGQ